jgi:hypothetical protein
VAQVEDHLLSKCETLSSNPSTPKKWLKEGKIQTAKILFT